MELYKTNKKVLNLKNNVESFLNGITSNTLDAPNNAFLNIHGRIVATFDQVKVGEDEYYVLIEESFVKATLEHIDRYVKLSGVSVECIDPHVYFDLNNEYSIEPSDIIIPQKHGKLIVTPHVLESSVDDNTFTLFRLQHHIPWHGIDYRDEMLLNVSTTDFVSFTKGCYLGQEAISKVYNRSKPTWKLVVKNEEDCNDEEKEKLTSSVINPETNMKQGFVFVKNV